jgi:methionine synthase II (cobalamin-independent)
MADLLLPASLVGSYAQPERLIYRKERGRFPPRVRVKELWCVAPEFLEQAQDATLVAIHDQERAGFGIITDGVETAQSGLDCSVLKTLPGKTIILGTLDLSDMAIEAPETVAARIRRALPHVRAEPVVAPDCGLKPRHVAFGKIYAMVQGAKIVRKKLTGHNAT